MTKKVTILGSTGSIGRQALQVVDEHPEEYEIVALAAGRNTQLLVKQIEKYHPRYVNVAEKDAAQTLQTIPMVDTPTVTVGERGLLELACLEGTDLLVVAVTGIHGLLPTLKALEKGITVALANKETIVAGGSLVMEKARQTGTAILPLDSEHSALFQCIEEDNKNEIEKLIITASGGPFLHWKKEDLVEATPAKALKHPKWQMGRKITVDSASMINKGLEVIEAHWLFDVPYEKIEVLVHPQSIIHSMVQYADGVVMAQMGMPDMRVPIQYAMTYPKRRKNPFPRPDFIEIGEMTFFKPDFNKFRGLALAYEAGKTGGTMPVVFNAANEKAVSLFLKERIKFSEIPILIEKAMDAHLTKPIIGIDDILQADEWAREEIKRYIRA